MREFKSYTCPLCGEISKQPKKHWKSKHRYEITWVEFMKLIQGKSYCLECGKELEPKVVDRVPKFCDYSCELKYRNKHGIGVKSRECPLCGKSFRGLWEHWETNHKDEVSWEMFLALLQGLDEIPRCKYCGEQAEYSWSNKCYKQTCGSEECERKLALEQGCKLHSTYYGDATLYLIGFYDTRTKKFCVKCGMSYFLNHRLSFFKNVGYILKM